MESGTTPPVPPVPPPLPPVPPPPTEKSSTGLDPNVAGALAYVLGFITGILFLVIEKDSKFVRFHAMQSTVTFLGIWIVNMAIWQMPLGVGVLFNMLLVPVTLLLWLFLMFKAYQGERFKLPLAGDIAEKNV